MLLIKSILWMILFPLTLIGYTITLLIKTFGFLFDAPVNVWQIINKVVDSEVDLEKS